MISFTRRVVPAGNYPAGEEKIWWFDAIRYIFANIMKQIAQNHYHHFLPSR
jgi:hypothetical protein